MRHDNRKVKFIYLVCINWEFKDFPETLIGLDNNAFSPYFQFTLKVIRTIFLMLEQTKRFNFFESSTELLNRDLLIDFSTLSILLKFRGQKISNMGNRRSYKYVVLLKLPFYGTVYLTCEWIVRIL